MKKSQFVKECMIWIKQKKRYKILTKSDRKYVAEKTYVKFKSLIDKSEQGALRIEFG